MDRAHEALVDVSPRKDAKSLRDLLRLARSDLQDRTRRWFVNYIERSESARWYLFGILREVLGFNLIALDYEVKTRPRYTPGFSPIAMACFRLSTFFPDFPLFSVPFFRSCRAFSTVSEALLPYLTMVISS